MRKLVRWGSTLYDKFMLPHYVYEDMKEVCEDLQRSGISFSDCMA
ncbi:MAG: transglutaminase family protein [Chryseolinea sp.]